MLYKRPFSDRPSSLPTSSLVPPSHLFHALFLHLLLCIKPDNFFHCVNLSTNISQSVYFIYIYLSIYLSSSPLLLVSIMLHMNRILIFSVFQQCHTHFHNNNNNIVNRNLRALHVSSKIFLLIFSETK